MSDELNVLRRSPRINEDDVFRAADELLFQGQRPTIDRVRMRLGRGSPNTINDHLDRWWAKLGSRVSGTPRGQFPELPEQVGDALQRLWNEALSAAHEVFKTTLDSREQTLREQRQALDVQARELGEQSQLVTTRATVLEESLQLAREQLLAANRRAEALEATLAERDSELARVRGKNDLDRKAHEKARAKLEERHEVLEKRLLAEVDRVREQNKDTERQRRDARDALERLQRECNGLHIELTALRSRTKPAVSKPQPKKTRATAESRTKVASVPSKAAVNRAGPRRLKK
jgi:DNA repair exonuclease SbcCD ATPase subunit